MNTHNNATYQKVQDYYGKELRSKHDLKTNACCVASAMPAHLRKLLKNINSEVLNRFYGCGSPIPDVLEGITVLDLGCGTGRDCYLLSQLVGEEGKVIGIDMTIEQLEIANSYLDWHMKKFGFKKQNIILDQAHMENLDMLADNSIDLVVSNCVINLSPDKETVFSEIFRVLKPGGELHFSDVFADRRIPEELQHDKVMLGECLGGALYIEDFRRLLNNLGIHDYRVVSSSPLSLENTELEQRAGMINFTSQTIRVFNCQFEDMCENYGQAAYYLGTIENAPHQFILDNHHCFKTGLPVPICSNTATMLTDTRYAPHFRVIGSTDVHYGAFDCANAAVKANSNTNLTGTCC